jgi:alpha-ribazole phosphatase
MDLVLIRHPAAAVDAGVCYGRSDVPLAGDARASSDAVFARLAELGVAPPQAVWTSPLRRCASVAAWLGRRCRCAVTADSRLREIDFGAWERMRWDAIDRAALDAWAADFVHARVHGGESVAQFAARVAAWFEAWRVSSGASAGTPVLPVPSGFSAATGSSRSSNSAISPVQPNQPGAPSAPASSITTSGASEQTASMQTAYVVTHAGVMRVLASLTLSLSVEEVQSWPLEVASIVWLRHERANDAWRLVRWNA